jgi:hypothetical protein
MCSKPQTILFLRQRKGFFFVLVNHLNRDYGKYTANISI